MAKLSAEEQAVLKRLTDKAKAPDAPQSERRLNISIDLGDETQVTRAQKLGLLDMFSDDDDPDPEKDPEEPDPEDTPKRRGFFTGE